LIRIVPSLAWFGGLLFRLREVALKAVWLASSGQRGLPTTLTKAGSGKGVKYFGETFPSFFEGTIAGGDASATGGEEPCNPDDKIAKTTFSDAEEFCSLLLAVLPAALRATLLLEPKRMRLLNGEFIAKNFGLLKTDLLWRIEYRPGLVAAGFAPECAFVVLHFESQGKKQPYFSRRVFAYNAAFTLELIAEGRAEGLLAGMIRGIQMAFGLKPASERTLLRKTRDELQAMFDALVAREPHLARAL
jgi:hypothetical protein